MSSTDDLVSFCMPDFGKCAPAVNDLVPNIKEAIDWFLGARWLDIAWNGTKDWAQDPFFACWFNIPLCTGLYCVPCCNVAVYLRTMEKMTGKSCESNCLSCCVMSLCCYFWACYSAKKRTEFRRKYGLKGAPLWDCVGPCCFGPCLLCQDANQLMADGGFRVPYCSLQEAAAIRAKVAPELVVGHGHGHGPDHSHGHGHGPGHGHGAGAEHGAGRGHGKGHGAAK